MKLKDFDCFSCGSKEVRVLKTKKSGSKGQGSIWRKVECKKCGKVFEIYTIYD